MSNRDRYRNYKALSRKEREGVDYAVVQVEGAVRDTLVLAPHAGGIEPGTSELARVIAGDDFSLYLFEGLKSRGNSILHITSSRFDEPRCLDMLRSANYVIAVHGCSGENRICVGGLDQPLAELMVDSLRVAGLPASATGHEFPGQDKQNICNRGARGAGVQLEVSRDLRMQAGGEIADAVRSVLASVVEIPVGVCGFTGTNMAANASGELSMINHLTGSSKSDTDTCDEDDLALNRELFGTDQIPGGHLCHRLAYQAIKESARLRRTVEGFRRGSAPPAASTAPAGTTTKSTK